MRTILLERLRPRKPTDHLYTCSRVTLSPSSEKLAVYAWHPLPQVQVARMSCWVLCKLRWAFFVDELSAEEQRVTQVALAVCRCATLA